MFRFSFQVQVCWLERQEVTDPVAAPVYHGFLVRGQALGWVSEASSSWVSLLGVSSAEGASRPVSCQSKCNTALTHLSFLWEKT